jgi:hypothetical protein
VAETAGRCRPVGCVRLLGASSLENALGRTARSNGPFAA